MKITKISSSLLLLLCFLALNTNAQKLKTEQVNYSYKRLPALPTNGITNYQVTFDAAYETKNAQALKEYEQQKKEAYDKYKQELSAYSAQVKLADARYEKEMVEYNKKTTGKKAVERVLLDARKPVREQISRPYMPEVEKPVLQSSYDYKMMASTYINLEGYQNVPDNALKVVVILYGYNHTQPRTISEESNNMRVSGGSASTYKSINYHTEFSYRHPMAVKVYMPDGKEVMSLTPPELNSYKIYKGPSSDRPPLSTDTHKELLVKNYEEKILQENLRFLNSLLNDKFGHANVSRTATLYYIKNADNAYADITTAFNEASSGLLILQQDAATGLAKLKKACQLWNTALNEVDMNNKKARINKEIAIGLYFNLLEAYYACGDVLNGQATLDKLNTLSLSNTERRSKLDFDMLFAEQKNRQLQN